MKLTLGKKLGQCEKVKAPVGTWRKHPGDFDAAAHAAHHYAKRDNRRMVVVPGNSYGHLVYHIAKDTQDVKSFTEPTGKTHTDVAVVTVDGEVFQAVASKSIACEG